MEQHVRESLDHKVVVSLVFGDVNHVEIVLVEYESLAEVVFDSVYLEAPSVAFEVSQFVYDDT